MKISRKSTRKRSAMPIVNTAVAKALDQLVLAQNAAAISGQDTIASTIGSVITTLRNVKIEPQGSRLIH